MTFLPLRIFPFPFKLTVHSHLDLHYAFRPKFTRHIDNSTWTVYPSSPHHCLSFTLKYWKCLTHYSALAFSSSFHLIPYSLSSSLWRSKWRQRSSLLSSSSPAKLAACSIRRWLQAVKPPAPESWWTDLLLICSISVSSTRLVYPQRARGKPSL